ncbi:unnamed protein product [Symbiodinium sp. CCMP2456]|nr:unnamed protein product [Symbiodinium sp. CCMP2456]
MVRREQGWHSGDAECEHRHPHGCPGSMCDMTAGGSLVHGPLPEWELQMKQVCNCVNPDLTLRIASLAGEILELGVRNDWTIAQVKAKMERVHNISAEHACLSFGGVLLHDSLHVEKLHFNGESPPISWIRRHPDVVHWLKRVNADWGEIGQAPDTIRKSPEVMLAVLHQAHHAICLADTELLCDAVFLQQACEMRIQDVADIHMLLCYAIAERDDDLAKAVMNCEVYRELNAQDCVDLVVSVASQGNAAESVKLELMKLLRDRIPAKCLAKGFISKAVVDKDLAVALIESDRAASKNPGPFRKDQGRLLLMPPALHRHDFAWQVLLMHKETFSRGSFEQLLRCVKEDKVPLDNSLVFVSTCLSYGQLTAASRAFGRAADSDAKMGAQVVLETKLPLTSLSYISSADKTAQIFDHVLSVWAPAAATLLPLMRQDEREILQLLRWTESRKMLPIATCHRLHAVLDLILEEEEGTGDSVQVGRLLMRAFVACSVLHSTMTERLPLAWLEDLRGVENGEKLVAQALLGQLERCSDERLLEKMPRFWDCAVWAQEDGCTCERAVSLLNRWCAIARQGPKDTSFALKVLYGLPLICMNRNALCDLTALPVQVEAIVANQRLDAVLQGLEKAQQAAGAAQKLASEALAEARGASGLARKATEEASQARSAADRAGKQASEALREASQARSVATEASKGADRASKQARDAVYEAGQARSDARWAVDQLRSSEPNPKGKGKSSHWSQDEWNS